MIGASKSKAGGKLKEKITDGSINEQSKAGAEQRQNTRNAKMLQVVTQLEEKFNRSGSG